MTLLNKKLPHADKPVFNRKREQCFIVTIKTRFSATTLLLLLTCLLSCTTTDNNIDVKAQETTTIPIQPESPYLTPQKEFPYHTMELIMIQNAEGVYWLPVNGGYPVRPVTDTGMPGYSHK